LVWPATQSICSDHTIMLLMNAINNRYGSGAAFGQIYDTMG
jgi:hypothetical protein